jgi:Host cell surface-exposed lipoprotein
MGGFSEQGLMNQLMSSSGEGFSQTDALYAVHRAGANWTSRPLAPPRATWTWAVSQGQT